MLLALLYPDGCFRCTIRTIHPGQRSRSRLAVGYRWPVSYPQLIEAAARAAVIDAVDAAREALAALHRHPANVRGWPHTAAAAAVRAARASAVLDGGSAAIDSGDDAVRDPVLAGALRVSAALPSLAAIWSRSPLQALARMHTLAAADLVDDSDALGRPVRAASRVAAAAELARSTDWPVPVVVAVLHGELLTAKPFDQASGVVARAAGRLAAMAGGLDPRGLGVPEVAQLRAGENYRLLAARFADGSVEGIAGWLIASCEWLQAGAREGASIARAAG